MTKSFRNLILSLFLAAGAAGLAACEGERGPVGEAGPTGTAGAAGPKGAAGDPGRSSDEIPNAYEFLKAWGKADGMAACNDDILNKTGAFPGPAVLPKAATAARRPPLSATATTVSFKVNLGDPANNAHKGRCSNKVFPGTAGEATLFTFTPTHTSEWIRETKTGTTAVLGNPTFTEIRKRFWGGTFSVDLKAEAAAAEGTDRLAVRCDGRKRPADAANDGKTITGEYRSAAIIEDRNILEEDNGIKVIKDSHDPPDTRNDYHTLNFTTRFCIRLASVPGTVKCLVKTAFFERNPNDDKKKGLHLATRKVTEQIALYKGGQLMQVMPMPYSDSKLAGSSPADSTALPNNESFPFAGDASSDQNFPPGKLCNFFGDAKVPGVIPCLDGEVPGNDGDCTP